MRIQTTVVTMETEDWIDARNISMAGKQAGLLTY